MSLSSKRGIAADRSEINLIVSRDTRNTIAVNYRYTFIGELVGRTSSIGVSQP